MATIRIALKLGILVCLGSVAQAAETTITATGFEQHDGELLEFGYADPRSDGGFEVLDLAFVENGEATVRADIENPLVVDVRLLVAEEESAAVRGVIEPAGRFQVASNAREGGLRFTGGNYNPLIFPSSASGESELETEERLRQIYLGHDDPTARLLALQAAWLEGDDDDQNATFEELRAVLGENRAIDLMHALRNRRVEEIARAMKYFAALNLDGEEVRLEDVLQENRYTLVEFWASWCGPCIAEIPYLKSAYANFRDKGFEILSVNLDEDPEAWKTASVDDYEIPWLNVCDGEAFDSTIAKLYRVKGIPANYLITSDGKRVARHLRGESLERKLSELFPE